MTKTIRTTNCLVVVLSSLTFGCAKNLPELPLDAPYNPGPVQQVASFESLATPLPAPSPAVSGGVIFEETRLDSSDEIYVEATVDDVSNTYDVTRADNGIDIPLVFIANDLVEALSFIGGMDPNQTTIGAPASASEFDTMVKNSMLRQGYRFNDRRVAGSRQLTTSFLEVERNAQLSELTAIMALNGVLIKRTYAIQNDTATPRTSYVIRGIDPELVDFNEQVSTL